MSLITIIIYYLINLVNKLFKNILKIIGILVLGALGALFFNLFLLPYMIASPYFENLQLVKYFKDGKIIVNKTDQVYIQENTAIEDAIERVEKSVVAIQSTKLGLKSGIVVTSDGLLITLASAIPTNDNFTVSLQGEQVGFDLVKIDAKNNLALIKLSKNNLQTIGFADVDKIKLGQAVFLVVPTLNNWLANEGIIKEIDPNLIKTNILESQAVAGSPLFNSTGELVGINFIDQDGKVLAVPVDKIQTLLGL